jgi:FAD/FMN-containing dehydrogenase
MSITTTRGDDLATLRATVVGDVLLPGEDGYAEAAAGFNLAIQHRPAVLVVAADTSDVAAAVRFATSGGYPIAIHATGHGTARPSDGGVLIVLSRLTGVQVDAVARTARIEGGAKWAAVMPLAAEHGLAPLVGSTTDVGAVGYTLGGGFGWLGRRYGLSSDAVRWFDLVTADGEQLRASAEQNPEVFWALKGGGGGSLGVVTAMEIELFPVDEVYAGNLFYPAFMARDVIRRWRQWPARQDERLTSSFVLMNFPPMDEVPEPLRGQSFVMVRGCWSGDLAEGAAVIDEWRDWHPPVIDMFGPMPFAMNDAISQDPPDPIPAQVSTEWFDVLEDEAVEVLVKAALPEPGRAPMLVMTEVRHAGGAVKRNAAHAANDRGRSGEYLLEMVGIPMDGHVALALEAHLRHTREALAPYVTGATYLNFTEGSEKQDRTASAFSPHHLARLRAVKAVLDPDDVFCHGFDLTDR